MNRTSGDTSNAGRWPGRAILHVDMDAFFASVEQLDHPEWRGRPVVVGGTPDGRGVIAAASYEARRYGVRSAMPAATAARLLPKDAVWTRGRFERYRELSDKVREIFCSVTPHVQPTSVDEAYLDVTPGETGPDPVELAREIQLRVDALGLSCSIGVAATKSVAKVASDHDKPHGITVVMPGDEATFLAPLPVRAMQGIGPSTEKHLNRLGIRTLGELAAMDETTAAQVFGTWGSALVQRARGIDTRSVHDREPARSLSHEHTFAHDVRELDEVTEALRALCERVGARMRRKGLAGRTVTVKVRFSDFTTKTVRRTLSLPTDLEDEFFPVAYELLRGVWTPGAGLRLLGVGLSGFEEAAEQLDLFSEAEPEDDGRRRALVEKVDEVKRRFGSDAVGLGGRGLRRREDKEDGR